MGLQLVLRHHAEHPVQGVSGISSMSTTMDIMATCQNFFTNNHAFTISVTNSIILSSVKVLRFLVFRQERDVLPFYVKVYISSSFKRVGPL